MGWYGSFCGPSMKEIKSCIEKDFEQNRILDNGTQFVQRILHHSFNFGKSYMAVEQKVTSKDGVQQDRKVFGALNLWRYSKKNNELMVKTIDESMGPYYYDAPAKLLKMLTEPVNVSAHNWRVHCWKKFKNIPKEYKEYKDNP
ncbi:MAG: hypothetical protein ACOC1O_00310 [bacterium]